MPSELAVKKIQTLKQSRLSESCSSSLLQCWCSLLCFHSCRIEAYLYLSKDTWAMSGRASTFHHTNRVVALHDPSRFSVCFKNAENRLRSSKKCGRPLLLWNFDLINNEHPIWAKKYDYCSSQKVGGKAMSQDQQLCLLFQGKLGLHGIISACGKRKFLYHRHPTFVSFSITKISHHTGYQ